MKIAGLCYLILSWVCVFCCSLAFCYSEVNGDIYACRDVIIVVFKSLVNVIKKGNDK